MAACQIKPSKYVWQSVGLSHFDLKFVTVLVSWLLALALRILSASYLLLYIYK